MSYSAEVNEKIINFMNRAQERIAKNALADSKAILKRKFNDVYENNLDESEYLHDFMTALDDRFNNWSEKRIRLLIDTVESKFNLGNKAYATINTFNQNIDYDQTTYVLGGSGGGLSDGDTLDGGTAFS